MKMTLNQVNNGSRFDEKKYVEMAKQFDNCDVTLNNHNVTIKEKGKTIFQCEISLYEEDGLTITYKGLWPDGKSFRIVRPGSGIIELVQALQKETFTFGSMFSDGYAVTYIVK